MPRPLRMVGKGFLLAALATCSLTGSASAALAPNITVDEDSEVGGDPNTGCSLREAVTAANTDGVYGGCSSTDDGEEGISLPDGDYVLTRDGVDDTNLAGDLDILNEGVGLNNFGGPVTIRGDLDMVGDDRVVDVLSSAPTFAVRAVTVRDGRATGVGGGIRTAGTTGVSFITNSTLTANQATSHGGGLEIAGAGTVQIRNSTFSGNLAGGDGGGIDNSAGGLAVLRNVTVTDNTADAGSPEGFKGGGIVSFMAGTEIALYNSIVAGNFDLTLTAGTFAPDCFEYLAGAEITSETHNLIGDMTGCEGISAGMGDIRNANPLLAPLALNRPGNIRGTATHALLAASPARDTGDPGACEATDQTNTDRPLGPVCDIGAFEADPNPPATGPTVLPATTPTSTTPRKKKCKKKKRKRSAAAAKKCKKKKKRR